MVFIPAETMPRVRICTDVTPPWFPQMLEQAGYAVDPSRIFETPLPTPTHLLIVDSTISAECLRKLEPNRPAVLAFISDEREAESVLSAGVDDYVTAVTPRPIILRRIERLVQAHVRAAHMRLQDVLFSNMSDAVIVVDNREHVLYWNDGARAQFGKTADAMVGKPLTDAFTYHLLAPNNETTMRHAVETDGFWNGEAMLSVADGRTMLVDSKIYTLRETAETPQGYVIVIRDTTERKRMEAAEREQRIMAEALRDTAAALTRTLDPQTVMNLILENVGRVVPHQTANIMLIDGGTVRTAFSRGYADELTDFLKTATFPLAFPTFQEMSDTGQSILVQDTQNDPRWHPMRELGWVRSYVATPIRAYDHVIGFLNLDSDKPGAFSEADAERLRAFADQAAIAIENAQLYDAIYRDASEMRALHRATAFLFTTNLFTSQNVRDVAEQIAQTVVNEFGKVDCGVILMDESGQLVRLARAGEYGMRAHDTLRLDGPGLVPEAIRTGNIIYAGDVFQHPLYQANDDRTRSELVVPLRTIKGVIGVLDLQSAQTYAFDMHDQRVLQAFAERAASAIENMRLYNEIQQRVSERTSELNRVKERAEAILNHSSDAILLLRDDGRIQQTNNAFNEMFGYGPDEAFGKTLTAIAGPYYAELLKQSLQEVVQEKRAVRVEITAANRENAAIDADVVMSPVFTQGQVTSVVCSLRDISQRKRMEFELRDALEKERELNELKSRFIARASHEFRTPLAMISTASDLLKNYGHRLTQEQFTEKLNRMQAEIRNITSILDDLLMISKTDEVGRQEFQPTLMNLATLCDELVDEMKSGIGMEHVFEFLTSGACDHVYADRKLIRRAVLNLLSNAVKYSPAGSKIQLSLSCDANQTVIVVQDSGIGIPEDDQKGLFEAFHRGHNVEHISGTGLGLAIVKQSVELHGGAVSFSSQVGIGSAFTLTIPNLALKEELA